MKQNLSINSHSLKIGVQLLGSLNAGFQESWAKKEQIDMNVSRSEGLDEIKAMIEQTDHLLNVERPDVNTDS